MKISIDIEDKEIIDRLEKLKAKMGNLKPLMDEIGQRYERRVLENFRNEQSPDGAPWPRLSKDTLLMGLFRKKGIGKKGGLVMKGRTYLQNKQMLIESGRLRSRVHYQADEASATIGVNGIPYAAIHQFGGMAGRGRKVKIPARPYLGVNQGESLVLAETDRRWILEVINRYMEVA